MLIHILEAAWAWFQWIAQIWDPVAFLVIMALGLRAVVRDRRSYKQRENDREVVVTLNSLLRDGSKLLPTLRIRNMHETNILDAMGQSKSAVELLLKAARAVLPGNPVIKFTTAFDAREIVHEITNELSTINGIGFLGQEVLGVLAEHAFIFAVTCEREAGSSGNAVNVRVQLILERHLDSLENSGVDNGNLCCWQLAEPGNGRYQTRDKTLKQVVRAYRDWKAGRSGSELLAIGRVFMVPPKVV